METLKPLSELTVPDERNTYFVVTNSDASTRKLSLPEIHAVVSNVTLHDGVPEAVRSHFSRAQNLAVYSWFHSPFNVTAQLMAFISVELALQHRFESRDGFKKLIARAVGEGLIKDGGFAIAAKRDESLGPYVDKLIEVMPSLRNRVAHGSGMLHSNSLSSLRTCADFINQLFPLVQSVG